MEVYLCGSRSGKNGTDFSLIINLSSFFVVDRTCCLWRVRPAVEPRGFEQQRPGQVFCDHFKPHKLTGQAPLRSLYEAEGEEASA